MINIFICDDEKVILNKLSIYVKNFLTENNVVYQLKEFNDSLVLLNELKEENADILLLDIDMPKINGLEIAEELKKLKIKPILIFVTCHDALVYETFQYHPFDFIRKSYYERDLCITLKRAMKQIANQKKYYCMEQAEGTIRLPVSDILYFEACGNYLKVITKEKSFLQRNSLQQVEQELKEFSFVRIHRGFLINKDAVYILKSDKVILINGEEIPIGRHYSVLVRQELMINFRG